MYLAGQQPIRQLEKRKGGYFYLTVGKEEVLNLSNGKSTRVICKLDNMIEIRCGLNHLGDGNFFVIIGSRYLKKLGKGLDDWVDFEISEDPDQLGVEMPEVLTVLLDQDEIARNRFDQLTDGKKRSLIYSIMRIKDIDKQVHNILTFLENEASKHG